MRDTACTSIEKDINSFAPTFLRSFIHSFIPTTSIAAHFIFILEL